jgi:hypothetical protein
MELKILQAMNSKIQELQNKQQFHFEYTVIGQLKEFVLLQLFDGDGKLIADVHERISIDIPKGLYQLYIHFSEKLDQKLIRLDKNYSGTWENIGSYSSIPDVFLKSSQEYYTKTAKHWSTHPTIQKNNLSEQNASLFLFFRYPDKNVKEQQQQVADSMGWRLMILNSSRQLIYRLQENAIQEDKEMGWLAFHAKLFPGIYYLVYNGPKKREIPLYVFPGWQTQFFLTFKRTPIFQTARIQLVRPDNSFEITGLDNLELDTLLQNMQNGIYYVPPSLINKTAWAKWENPMLAIVVCYAYLLSAEKNDDDLFRIIIQNLQQRILSSGEAPDIKAIQLLAALHFKEEIPVLVLKEPCMLTVGIKNFIEQATRNPNKITINEECEEIITYLQTDTVWTSYIPLEYEKNADNSERLADFFLEENILAEINYTQSIKTFTKEEQPKTPKDWLSQSIIDQLSSEYEKVYSVESLAVQFQVSPTLVTNRVRRISNLLAGNQHLLTSESEIGNADSRLKSLTTNIQNILKDN